MVRSFLFKFYSNLKNGEVKALAAACLTRHIVSKRFLLSCPVKKMHKQNLPIFQAEKLLH